MSTMLYKCPGKHKLHGIMCDYTIVDCDTVDEAIADGWHKSPLAADKAYGGDELKQESGEPTRDELKQKASELGIKVTGRMKDATIAKKIKEALS